MDLAADVATQLTIRNKLHRPNVAMRDGARIAFYEHGSGEHTLLFVNPIVYGLAIFQPILEQLCQEFRIITIDCRGTGSSDPLTRPFLLSEHVEDVAAVIKNAGCGAVFGVGISRGSNLLIKLAAAHPEMISRLILWGARLLLRTPAMSRPSLMNICDSAQRRTRSGTWKPCSGFKTSLSILSQAPKK